MAKHRQVCESCLLEGEKEGTKLLRARGGEGGCLWWLFGVPPFSLGFLAKRPSQKSCLSLTSSVFFLAGESIARSAETGPTRGG